MELLVQKLLRSGKTLDNLKEEFGIKSSTSEGLAILNYDQINSTKTDPVVMECRGLILEEGSWDVVSMAFRRFFNYGEALEITEDFDFSKAHVLEKIDGSIISVFHYNGKWMMATRGTIEGTGEVGFLNLTFRQLFDKIIDENYPNFWDNLDDNFGYVFELVSPESKVVKPYKRGLYLLGVRDKGNDFAELTCEDVQDIADIAGVLSPAIYPMASVRSILEFMGELETLDEGFVCVDFSKLDDYGQHPRIKVKNPAYVAIAHLKDSSACSMRALVQLVMAGETDEFTGYFPEFVPTVKSIREAYENHVKSVGEDAEAVAHLLEKEKTPENRKEFALAVRSMANSNFMFQLYEGKVDSFRDYILKNMEKKGAKNVSKAMMNTLNVKDMEFNQE
jgi:hypothetical protein